MTLPTIQSLWIGDPLSKLEQLCVQSFLDNGHEFHLYIYDDIGGIPDGVTVKDANEILSRDCIFHYSNGSLAGFANWFRYELLAKRGGMWADMDIVCIKPFAFGGALVFGHYLESVRDQVNTAVLGGDNYVWLWQLLSDECRDYPKIQKWDSWQNRRRKIKRRIQFRGREGEHFGRVGGARPLSAVLQHFDLIKHAKPANYFSPFVETGCAALFDDTYADGTNFGADNYALHLHNEHLRRNDYDKNQDFHPNSLIEQLKRKHKI